MSIAIGFLAILGPLVVVHEFGHYVFARLFNVKAEVFSIGFGPRLWGRLIGEDHIADRQDPERVVDVIFGILAKETGRVDYFRSEIEGRQTPVQVSTTYKALGTVHAKVDSPDGDSLDVLGSAGKGKSTMHKPTGGKAAKGLL